MSVESHGVFTPRPGAAPFWRMVLAQARMESRLMLRNGEQLLLAVVIPVIVLVGGVEASRHVSKHFSHPAVDVFTPGVLALAIMSTAFTSLAIATGFERRYGVIKRLGASPLPRLGLLAGKVLALVMVELLQLVVIGAVGLALGWSPTICLAGVAGFVLTAVVGTAAFASLGLFVA
ncbi:MAG: ABC transporter permease, partial [Nocardioides sp.]